MTYQPYYTRQEAAELLRVSVPTIDRWIRDGILASRKIGSSRPCRRLIPGDAIRALEKGAA